jgi:hypothetical protein
MHVLRLLPSVTDSGRSAVRYDLEADGKGQPEEHLPCLDRAPSVTGGTNQWGVSDLLYLHRSQLFITVKKSIQACCVRFSS